MYKKYFITGILSIIPIYLTYWIIQKVFFLLSVPGRTIVSSILELLNINKLEETFIIPIEYLLGFILTLSFFLSLGLIVSYVIGKRIYSAFENILD